MLILMTRLFLAPASTLVVINYKRQTNSCVRANYFSERVISLTVGILFPTL